MAFELHVHLTRQDFADMAGLTIETTSRIMSRFKKSGMVKGNARRLVICDLQRLQTLLSRSITICLSAPASSSFEEFIGKLI